MNANVEKQKGLTTQKRKAGRPRGDGFHGMLTAEAVQQYAEKLFTFEQIGALFGESRQNALHAIKSNEDLKNAFDKGHALALERLTGALWDQVEKGNTIAMIFILKTQFGWCEEQYKIGKQIDKENQQQVKIYLPHNGRDEVNLISADELKNGD